MSFSLMMCDVKRNFTKVMIVLIVLVFFKIFSMEVNIRLEFGVDNRYVVQQRLLRNLE